VEEVHLNHLAPSKAAQNSELVLNQNSTSPDAIFNGRPTTMDGPPLSIYHPIFSTFMREYSVPVDHARISEEDMISASNLMANAAKYYKEVSDRLCNIGPDLAHFLDIQWEAAFISAARKWVPDGNTKVTCPLSKRGILSPATLFFQLKKGHADPVEQAQHDHLLLCTSPEAGAFDQLNDRPSDLVYRWDHSADEVACLFSFLGLRDLI